MPQVKLKDLKNQAYAIARGLEMNCSQTQHFKRRGLTTGLDLRCKSSWIQLIARLQELAGGVVVPLLQRHTYATALQVA
ncbi:MAG: hypothetical protein PUP92_00915 [Rhizonema sp. PD38]|nr:hypothetical protein [Rhizonema sp. PD38]